MFHPEYVLGQMMTYNKVSRAQVDPGLRNIEKNLHLYMVVMTESLNLIK